MHDPLADGGGDEGLQHAEDAVHHRGEDHAESEQGEQPGPSLRDGGVQDLAQQERGGDRHQRRGADEQSDHREAAAVGLEESEDAAQLGRGLRGFPGRGCPRGFVGFHGLLRQACGYGGVGRGRIRRPARPKPAGRRGGLPAGPELGDLSPGKSKWIRA